MRSCMYLGTYSSKNRFFEKLKFSDLVSLSDLARGLQVCQYAR